MNVDEFLYCPYCARILSSSVPAQSRLGFRRCENCSRTLYSSPHPNVSVLICDLAVRQILLVKEPKAENGGEPNWEIPGGFVNVVSSGSKLGESLEFALQREIEEELGQQNAQTLIKNLSYLGSFGDTYTDGTPIVVAYFLVAIEKGDLVPSSNEDVLMKWFDISDLPCFEHRSDSEAIECVKKRF